MSLIEPIKVKATENDFIVGAPLFMPPLKGVTLSPGNLEQNNKNAAIVKIIKDAMDLMLTRLANPGDVISLTPIEGIAVNSEYQQAAAKHLVLLGWDVTLVGKVMIVSYPKLEPQEDKQCQ